MSEPARGSGRGVLVAVDGGGSKTDAVAFSYDGEVLVRASGPSSSPQTLGVDVAVSVLDGLVREVIAAAGRPADRLGLYLSGLDLPEEIVALSAAIAPLEWARNSVDAPIVDNDLFALLRAGTAERNAIAVVCGTGINAIGVREDGAQARFSALGSISGDWGGGQHLGQEALWYAARAEDGRGDETVLRTMIAEALGFSSVRAVTEALHFEQLPDSTLATLPPVIFAAAEGGDAVARSLIENQAREIVAMTTSLLQRLDLLDVELPVVLGGGVLASANTLLLDGIRNGLAMRAPRAHAQLVTVRPVAGAASLVLDTVGADAAAHARVQAQLG